MAVLKLSQITALGSNPAAGDYAVMTTSSNTVDSLVTVTELTAAINAIGGTWSAVQIFNSGDFKLAGSSSGSTIVQAAATASGTITIPAATDTLTGKATTDTLTNKTITSSTNSVGGVTAAFGSDAKGDIYTNSGSSNVIERLAVGSTNNLLTVASALPAWSSISSLGIASLTTTDQTLSGGANVTVTSLSTGNITIDCGTCPLQKITNGGSFTITAPGNDGSCMLMITNNGSAGAVTFSGFTVGSNTGDALDTTNTHVFTVSIWRINGVSGYRIAAHQ